MKVSLGLTKEEKAEGIVCRAHPEVKKLVNGSCPKCVEWAEEVAARVLNADDHVGDK